MNCESLWTCRQGRQLIYELSAKHHNCLLLNYAIQKILSKGYENEVASVGSSLASYFGVFHRLTINRLKEVPKANAQRLRQLSTELKVGSSFALPFYYYVHCPCHHCHCGMLCNALHGILFQSSFACEVCQTSCARLIAIVRSIMSIMLKRWSRGS